MDITLEGNKRMCFLFLKKIVKIACEPNNFFHQINDDLEKFCSQFKQKKSCCNLVL